MAKISEKIIIWGIVQGVGFRPFLAKLADKTGMKGEVRNSGGRVELCLTADEEKIDSFVTAIEREKPPQAIIVKISRERLKNPIEFTEFSILESEAEIGSIPMMAPDLAVCASCLKEMRDPANDRFRHPFISCMSCGPRYTIIRRLPYDRTNTSMDSYPLCSKCEREYSDIRDRRFHAETISCHECGPLVRFKSFGSSTSDELCGLTSPERTEKALKLMRGILSEGGIVGFKSTGGYNLVCDPKISKACEKLRKLKGREAKPFALMFEKTEEIRKFCDLNDAERELLESAARPIVLLKRLKSGISADGAPLFDGGRHSLGCFLPSIGLQYMLLEAYGGPLVFTSMNYAGLPIIYKDSEAFSYMEDAGGLVSGLVWNDREIVRSADDSVLRVVDGRVQMIRRSKGYAPLPLASADFSSSDGHDIKKGGRQLFACGGFLKSSFVLTKDGFYYPSSYLGDLDSEESLRRYETAAADSCRSFGIKPEAVLCDLHPDYPTSAFAEKYALDEGIKLIKIQHHHAHIASVMAEYGLKGPLIGIALDGTGYGSDGKIWGGEILLCEGKSFRRVSHLPYVRMIGGDSSASSAWKSALCYLYAYESGKPVKNCMEDIIEYAQKNHTLRAYEAEGEIVSAALEAGINCLESSSMGRLFDAASALLGICFENSYEGEAASALEDAAWDYLEGSREENRRLAFEFHENIAKWLCAECERIRHDEGINTEDVALSGGCFQNRLFLEKSLELLRKAGFKPYFNTKLPPNDGGLALGQAYLAEMEE